MNAEILPFNKVLVDQWQEGEVIVIGESEISCKSLPLIRETLQGNESVIVVMPETDLGEGGRGLAKANILLAMGADRIVSCTFEEVAYLLSGEYGEINQVGNILFLQENLVIEQDIVLQSVMFEETNDPFDIEMIRLAEKAVETSNCWLDPAGSMFVRDGEVLLTSASTSFNNSRCKELPVDFIDIPINTGERMRFCDSLHSERVGISEASSEGISLVGSTIYLTKFPCRSCMQEIISAGISRVVFERGSYGLKDAGLLLDNGVLISKVET